LKAHCSPTQSRPRRRLGVVCLGVTAALAISVAGCSTLPEDGPSARLVTKQAQPSKAPKYALLDVDFHVTQVIDANPSRALASLRSSTQAGPSDLIAVGDTLAVSIIQPGFGPSPQQASLETQDTSTSQSLPRVVVDRDGRIAVPYAGSVLVAGLTPNAAASAVKHALKGKVADPQVVITSVSSPRNSVIVLGEVRNPSRVQLTANSDRLLDALAAVGGPTKPALDLTLTVVRGDQSATISVATLLQDPAENIRLAPQDQVRIMAEPRKIDVFGAVGRGAQIPIEDDTLTLAGALARIGGLNSTMANASSVLVFRFERPEVATALGVRFPDIAGLKGVPIIYRVNLRDPSGYFVASKFNMVPDDLIYVPTADASELGKFLNIVNSAAQFLYDAAVTKSLG
jgi:polysaccharide export outer membrane protein